MKKPTIIETALSLLRQSLAQLIITVAIVGAVNTCNAALVVVADFQITEDVGLFPGNESFVQNVIGNATTVLFTPELGIQVPLYDYVGSLGGVTASLSEGGLGPGALDGVDLLVIHDGTTGAFQHPLLPFDDQDIQMISTFLLSGGDVLAILEPTGPVSNGNVHVTPYNDFLEALGSDIRFTGERFVGFGFITPETHHLTNGVGSVNYAAYSPLDPQTGTPLFQNSNGALVSVDFTTPIPIPSAIYLIAAALAVVYPKFGSNGRASIWE